VIEFIDVSKKYAEAIEPSVDEVSLIVEQGEVVVLVGTSGSGKTTLLKMVNRLLSPTSGIVRVAGSDVRQHDLQALRRSIGYVFQRFGLLPHLTVGENIALPLKIARKPADSRIERVHELLEFMSLPTSLYLNRFPDQLSGGQQQRVQVARALAHDPKILLLDEPFGALDVITRSELHGEMLRLKRALKKTMLLVTHDITEAFLLGDRIAIMHQGHIHQVGTKRELLQNPATGFVKIFLQAALQGIGAEVGQ
jgi:osmoprotectant transport system ATP-binding protein